MGRQKIYRWHVGKAPRVSRGRKWREMEKDGGRGSTGADRRRNAGKGGGERRGGEGKSERKRTRMVAAGRQMTADRRKTHPNCSTVSLSRLFLRMSPPLPSRIYSSRGGLVTSERPISKIFGEAATRATGELF